MKKMFCALLVLLAVNCFAQDLVSADTINAPAEFENIHVRKLYSDSLASSFVIFVKKEVKAHKHLKHTEHVYILEGAGTMLLGEKKIMIKKGDVLYIPKGVVHALTTTSKIPVKLISIQAPFFDGSDRVWVK